MTKSNKQVAFERREALIEARREAAQDNLCDAMNLEWLQEEENRKELVKVLANLFTGQVTLDKGYLNVMCLCDLRRGTNYELKNLWRETVKGANANLNVQTKYQPAYEDNYKALMDALGHGTAADRTTRTRKKVFRKYMVPSNDPALVKALRRRKKRRRTAEQEAKSAAKQAKKKQRLEEVKEKMKVALKESEEAQRRLDRYRREQAVLSFLIELCQRKGFPVTELEAKLKGETNWLEKENNLLLDGLCPRPRNEINHDDAYKNLIVKPMSDLAQEKKDFTLGTLSHIYLSMKKLIDSDRVRAGETPSQYITFATRWNNAGFLAFPFDMVNGEFVTNDSFVDSHLGATYDTSDNFQWRKGLIVDAVKVTQNSMEGWQNEMVPGTHYDVETIHNVLKNGKEIGLVLRHGKKTEERTENLHELMRLSIELIETKNELVLYESAVKRIQKWWRVKLLLSASDATFFDGIFEDEINFDEIEFEETETSATKIQSMWRGIRARCIVRDKRANMWREKYYASTTECCSDTDTDDTEPCYDTEIQEGYDTEIQEDEED